MATLVPQKDDVEHWTVEQVAAWLQQVELSDCCDTFLRRGIDGHGFLQLSQDNLPWSGRDVSVRNLKQILKLVSQIKSQQQHPSTTRQPIEISRSLGSHPPKTYNDYAMDFPVKDFFGEEEEHTGLESPPAPPIPPRHQGQSPSLSACPSFPRTNTGQNNILHGPESRSLETHNDDIWGDYDSSFDEEESEEHPGQKMQLVKENDQGEENIDDLYLVPLPANSPASNHSSIINRELPNHSQLPTNTSFIHQHGGGSWSQSKLKKERLSFGSDTQNNRRSHPPAIPERAPVRPPRPVNDTLMALHKQQSPLHHFQAPTPKRALHSPLQEAINHNLVENGSSGVKGASFSYRHQFPSSPPSRWQKDNEPSQAHLPTQSMEKNDHVYEIVDVPQGSYGGTEAPGPNKSDQQSPSKPPIPPPRNQNQDSDDRDLSSRLGSVSLSHGKRPPAPLPPPVAHNLSEGRNTSQARPPASLPPPVAHNLSEGRNTSQARPPAPDLPNRSDRSRQPAPPPSFSGSSSHSSHLTFPKESHAPQELLQNSAASCHPFISLENGEQIELTPLYRKIMEKPYFQFISRAKAKELVMQGKEGTFLIRPSTRTKMPFTLTVKHDDRYYNINIRQRPDRLFALGYEKASERTFSSIDEMVSTHYKEPITLVNGECALLKYSPSKPVWHVQTGH
ncbi:B-cell linker protein-like isoform X3 [Eriocheir sinensis]|uniref:B-cell linker protein-like isoform X3 n=1 Tax=Eriocheir sinensis TaxID=95602 RepID=UPI0021C7BE23|nr:B-cell linker protein-like isoform X3 [Eriocheir sinensis]